MITNKKYVKTAIAIAVGYFFSAEKGRTLAIKFPNPVFSAIPAIKSYEKYINKKGSRKESVRESCLLKRKYRANATNPAMTMAITMSKLNFSKIAKTDLQPLFSYII